MVAETSERLWNELAEILLFQLIALNRLQISVPIESPCEFPLVNDTNLRMQRNMLDVFVMLIIDQHNIYRVE